MTLDRFADLKARQALTWGAAPFERITETFAEVHDRLIGHLGPRPEEKWLDVATGTGPLALRAARAGATVTGVDLAPALVASARQLAGVAGLRIAYEVGDCERLAHPAASFDVVVSSFGTIFAPDHATVAAELARVCRPGGRLGLAAWQPDGGAARMAEAVMAFQPGPPPPGAGNPSTGASRTMLATASTTRSSWSSSPATPRRSPRRPRRSGISTSPPPVR